MYLLIRTISDYVFSDIILGVFTTLKNAEQAKVFYIQQRKNNDPWYDQPYRETILENDVNIIELKDSFQNGQIIFEVSEYSEGFGQDCRDLHSFHRSRVEAEKCIEDLEKKEELKNMEEDFSFPYFAAIDYLVVGELHSDISTDQPVDFMTDRDETLLEKTGKRKFAEIIDIAFPHNQES